MNEQSVDILIVTAVPEEYDAVRLVNTGAEDGTLWIEKKLDDVHNVAFRAFHTYEGPVIRVAVTWATTMGGVASASAAQSYFDRLQPRCLAMCGVCAGRRGEVNLGDVIVADRVWQYDFGARKVTYSPDGKSHERYQADITTYQVPPGWKQEIERFQPDRAEAAEWVASRPIPFDLQLRWILERLLANERPIDHADRKTHCPDWSKVLERHEKLPEADRLLDEHVKLTAKGKAVIQRLEKLHPDGLPTQLDFCVRMGVIGTGNQLVRDEHIFDLLADDERKVLGLEMEAASIGALAHLRDVPFIVMKGVMDHADPEKNDNFKEFAARASAECLLAFLRSHPPAPRRSARGAPLRSSVPEIELVFPPTGALVQSRVFSDNYDSVRQAFRFDSPGASAVHSIVGRLRFDMLLSRTLVLTDTQVLDGRILQELALSEVWRKIAAEWPSRVPDRPMLEIRSRSETLRDAFVGFIAAPAGKSLRRFEFSSLDLDHRLAVANRMAERPGEAVSSPENVLAEMRAAGAEGSDVDRIGESLARWTEMTSVGAVKVVKWENTYSECWRESFARASETWKGELSSSWASGKRAQTLITELAGTGNRSRAYQLLREVSPLPGFDEERARDLARIRIWYDRYYNRAIAMQHGSASEWVCDVNDPIVFREEQQISREGISQHDGALMKRIREEGRVVDVSTEFTERLAEMPGDEFMAFVEKYGSQLNEWWSKGNPYDLAKIVAALVKQIDRQGKPASVAEWAESNRAAIHPVARVSEEPLRRVQVHFIVDDQSAGQRTSSHREPTL